MGFYFATCPACQIFQQSFLKPDWSRALLLIGFVAILSQSLLWLGADRYNWIKVALGVLSLGIFLGGAILFGLALQLGLPSCSVCFVFWVAQIIFAFRLASIDPVWRKLGPILGVSIALSGILVARTPSTRLYFQSLPFVELSTIPSWFGKSTRDLLPEQENGDFIIAAECSSCHQYKIRQFAARERENGRRRLFVLSEKTRDLRRFLDGHDVKIVDLSTVHKLLGQAFSPYLVRVKNFRIVEVGAIKAEFKSGLDKHGRVLPQK